MVTPVFKFGRETSPACWVSSGVKISNGRPLENVVIPETDQPRISAPAAPGRVVVGAPERKLPRVVHNQTMRDVEFGVAALGAQVERVSRIGREENVVADGNERICPVINGLRIGVGSLQREAV